MGKKRVTDLQLHVPLTSKDFCRFVPQILEAFSNDDSLFVRNCSQLISQSERVVTMPQYEFRQICDTKLESIRRRISSYQQVPEPPGRPADVRPPPAPRTPGGVGDLVTVEAERNKRCAVSDGYYNLNVVLQHAAYFFFSFSLPLARATAGASKSSSTKKQLVFCNSKNPGRTSENNSDKRLHLSALVIHAPRCDVQLFPAASSPSFPEIFFFVVFFSPPPSPVQFAQELRNKVWPSFRQAGGRLHPLGCLDFVPTNCHVNFMQVSYPKSTTSAGRTFSIRFGRKNSLFGLDPDQG